MTQVRGFYSDEVVFTKEADTCRAGEGKSLSTSEEHGAAGGLGKEACEDQKRYKI